MMTQQNENRGAVWKPLVICPRTGFRHQVAASLSGLGWDQTRLLTEYPAAGTAASLVQSGGRNICFLDVSTDPERAQPLIAEFSPLVPVVALHPDNDADQILRCLRRGACEFLSDPTADALCAVLERLSRTRSEVSARAPGEIYVVAPGKPGSGASTVAAHLAIQFHRDGADPVLLVDCDPLAASIAFQLKLKPEFHLEDVRRDWARMDEDLWGRLTLRACGVDVLAAPEDPSLAVAPGRDFASQVCAFWRERYEAVFIDVPDLRAAVESGFAAQADAILLVTTNELAALQTSSRALRCLDSGGSSRTRLRLILNRYTPATGLQRDDVKTVLALQPFACLCNEYDAIQTALLEGKPVPPGSRFGASISTLCRQLRRKSAPERKSTSWIHSLLHRPQAVSQ